MTTLITERPAEGITPAWSFPTVQRLSLEGVDVIAAHLAARPLVHATVLLPAGATADPVGREGAASLLGDLALRGAAGLDQHALAVAFERFGAVPSVSVSLERTDLDVEVPAGLLVQAVAGIADVLRRPTLDAVEFGRVRDARVDRLRGRHTDAGFRLGRAASRGLWAADSRLSRSSGGDVETLLALTIDDITAMHADWWATAPITLVLVGDLTGVDIEAVARPLTGTSTARVGVVTPAAPAATGTRINVVDIPGSVQSMVRIMAPGPAFGVGDDAALSVAQTAVFGSFGSRLNMRLREELGYTYGASGGFARLADAGWSQAGCSVRTEVTAESITEAVAVIRTAVADGLTDAEVAHARGNLVRKFAVQYDGAGPVSAALARRVQRGLADTERDAHLAALAAVTTEQAAAAFADAIPVDDLVITVAGAADEVTDALVATGLGPVAAVS